MAYKAVMTNVVTKPEKRHQNSSDVTEGYVAVTLKFDIKQFNPQQLGEFMLMLAHGDQVNVDIISEQVYADLTAAGAQVLDDDEGKEAA